jgi:hypothetical protein
MKSQREIQLRLIVAKKLGIELTTDQAPEAWPNGSRIVKTKLETGDAHPVGSMATVVDSLGPIPFNGVEKSYGYFVFWDNPPGDTFPSLVHDGRVGLAPPPEPQRSKQEAQGAIELSAFCPSCGGRNHLFDLKPDATRQLSSIACAACLAKRRGPAGGERNSCLACASPRYSGWKFCAVCGDERATAN